MEQLELYSGQIYKRETIMTFQEWWAVNRPHGVTEVELAAQQLIAELAFKDAQESSVAHYQERIDELETDNDSLRWEVDDAQNHREWEIDDLRSEIANLQDELASSRDREAM